MLDLNALPAGNILFDPSFSTQPDETNSNDTYNDSTATSTNYGSEILLLQRTNRRHAYIEFDASSIDGSATCDSATLSLWSAESNSTSGFLPPRKMSAQSMISSRDSSLALNA